jgi:hypothetical protein
MRIEQLEAQYEIPGFEIAPNAFEPEEAGDDFADAPFGQDAGVSAIPSPSGWQELLGLTTAAPTAISIDPPTRKTTSGYRSGITNASRVLANADPAGAKLKTAPPSVRRMIAVMARTRQTVARIRARAQEVA